MITEGKHQETPIARARTFEPGTVLVFDMGYLDFAWFAGLTARGVWSLSNSAALLRMSPFVYRDLWIWREQPLTAPPPPPDAVQGALPMGSTWTAAREVSS